MIIKDQGTEAISAGVLRTMDVGISDNPEDQLMILNILSDTLYTDKISAVWREYGCNGADANVEAGKPDAPIIITLPTNISPTASIRDFGGGMSEDQIANTYCKAGRSTKRNSNAMTGCLGIGSKAGYAYGPAFTVTSFHMGMKIVYNCFKDNGIPRMAKLHEVSTVEQDGVEISVPVRRPDIPEFLQRAERVFRYFRIRPIVKGGTIDFRDHEAVIKGTDWKFTASEHSVAIMGNVGYNLDYRMLPSDFPAKKKALVEAGIELSFPMGALQISANREGLQYKDETLKAISQVLNTALGEISQTFTDQVKNAPSLWEAQKIYAAMWEKSGGQGMRAMRETIDGKVTWNGVALKSGSFWTELADTGMEGAHVNQYTQRNYYTRGKRLERRTNPYNIPARDSTVLVMNNSPSGKIMISRIRYWFIQHTDVDNIVVFTFEDDKSKKAYIKHVHLEGAPTINMMDMPKPPFIAGVGGSGVSAHRAKHQARALEFDESKGRYTYPRSNYWLPSIVDKDGAGVYLPLEAYEPNGKVVKVSCDQLRELIKSAREMGLLKAGQKVIGIKKRLNKQGDYEPSVKLGPSWETLDDVLLEGIEKQFKLRPKLPQELADYIETVHYTPFIETGAATRLVKGCVARELLEEYVRMKDGQKITAIYDFYTQIPNLFKVALPKATTKLVNEEKNLWSRYPMLKYAEFSMRNASGIELQKAIDYINMVELVIKNKQVNKPK
jgi:hypothetical protein